MKIATTAIHAGQTPEKTFGAVIPPIYMTSTYAQEESGVCKGYDYTRAGNPNFTNLESALAGLEGGKHATVFSAGLGGLTALISTLKSGEAVVAVQGLYGGTYRLFNQVFKGFGVDFYQTPVSKVGELIESKKPKYLLVETPNNPLLEVHDIRQLADIAHKGGALLVVDNTFATPYNQNPLALGADVVWHSTTKYLGGHSDVIGGALITNDDKLKEAFDFGRKCLGLNPSPFDAWLTHRGVKTLAVRMQKHNENGQKIADWLEQHPLVKKVYYPGKSPIAQKQMRGFSGIVSAEFNLSLEQTRDLIASFKLFTLAESLGGIESLVCHPATMTHASIPAAVRHETGLQDGLVRLSVGIEDAEDLINDLASALKKFQ